MKLIDGWRQAYKFLSVQVATLLAVWGLLPPDQQAALMSWLGMDGAQAYVPSLLAFLVIYARVVQQKVPE